MRSGQRTDGFTSVLCGYSEILWSRMVSVVPSVICTVDSVCIDEGGVTAAIGDIAGVDAFLERNIGAAVGNDGQGGGLNRREAVNRCGVIGRGGKSFWIEMVSEGPYGIVSGAVCVFVTEDNRTRSVIVQVGGAVHIDGYDGVAADVADGVSGRSDNVHQTRDSSFSIGGHSGDDFRHHDVEGEGPSCINSCAVPISVSVSSGTCAIVDLCVDSGFTRRQQYTVTSIFHNRNQDGIRRGRRLAINGFGSIYGTNTKCCWSLDQDILKQVS